MNGRDRLSAVIIALNEAARIGACLESLAWVDEIVVVDSGSSDGTREIAERYGATVYDIPWRGFGPQKQAAVELASHDMILNVDCDERVTPELAREIQALLADGQRVTGYTVPRRTFFGSREIRHCGWYPDRTVRLFDRRHARFSAEPVHERVEMKGEVGHCRGDLLHYSFDGFSDLIAKMNRYTDIGAGQLLARGKRSNLSQVTLRPLFAFWKTYILRGGFLDGFAGFAIAVSNTVSVFYKYAKLRELQGRTEAKPR